MCTHAQEGAAWSLYGFGHRPWVPPEAHIDIAYIVTANIAMAYIAMAYKAMAFRAMACVVMEATNPPGTGACRHAGACLRARVYLLGNASRRRAAIAFDRGTRRRGWNTPSPSLRHNYTGLYRP